MEGNVLALVRDAEERARRDERARLYRMLHDSVLPTLTAIARGTINDSRLRARCAADASLIRGMVAADPGSPASLLAELTEVIHAQLALGLRIHGQFGAMPRELPAKVVAALGGACREALNNVHKHAGTDEAWVTATTGDSGTVTVTVVDRGQGMAAVRTGFGLGRSIAARMLEVGGVSRIDSKAGEGTCVELTWPG